MSEQKKTPRADLAAKMQAGRNTAALQALYVRRAEKMLERFDRIEEQMKRIRCWTDIRFTVYANKRTHVDIDGDVNGNRCDTIRMQGLHSGAAAMLVTISPTHRRECVLDLLNQRAESLFCFAGECLEGVEYSDPPDLSDTDRRFVEGCSVVWAPLI